MESDDDDDDDVSSDADDDGIDEKTPSQTANPRSSLSTPQQQDGLVGKADTTEQVPSGTRADGRMAPCSPATMETSLHTQPVCSSKPNSASEARSVWCTAIEPPPSIELDGNGCSVAVTSCDKMAQECPSERSVIGSKNDDDAHQAGDELSSGFSAEYEERVMQEAASLLASLSDTLLTPPRPSLNSCHEGTHLQCSVSNSEVSFCFCFFVCFTPLQINSCIMHPFW